MSLLFARKLYIFLVEYTLWDPSSLDGCNLETRQTDGWEVSCRRFYYINRGTTCFADFPSFRSKLNKIFLSNIRWFDALEKGAKPEVPKNTLRRFYHLYQSRYSDLSCYSIHIPVWLFMPFLDVFLLIDHGWNVNLAPFRSRLIDPVSQFSTRVCHVRLITKLARNCFRF